MAAQQIYYTLSGYAKSTNIRDAGLLSPSCMKRTLHFCGESHLAKSAAMLYHKDTKRSESDVQVKSQDINPLDVDSEESEV